MAKNNLQAKFVTKKFKKSANLVTLLATHPVQNLGDFCHDSCRHESVVHACRLEYKDWKIKKTNLGR